MVVNKKKRVKKLIKDKGILWTAAHIFNSQIREKISDKYTLWNKKNLLELNDEKSFVDLPSHTVNENKRLWNNYDWSEEGEEWTNEVKKYKGIDPEEWKKQLINEIMLKYLKNDSVILEIGPGRPTGGPVHHRSASHAKGRHAVS